MNWKYILIVIVLAAIVGGGILVYQYWWMPEEGPPPSPVDETANWKIYRNEKYGFEFKYPRDWKEPTVKDGDPYYKGEYFYVGISGSINKKHFSVTVTTEKPPLAAFTGRLVDVVISNKNVIAYVFPEGYGWPEYEGPEAPPLAASFHIPIQKGNLWFTLAGLGENAAEMKGVYQKILFTFKFIR